MTPYTIQGIDSCRLNAYRLGGEIPQQPPQNALELDGDNGYIYVGSADYQTKTMTIEAWFYDRGPLVFQPIVSWGHWNAGITLYLRDDARTFSVNAGIGGRREVTYSKKLFNRWRHVALTMNTTLGEAKVYLDGDYIGDVECRDDDSNLPTGGTLNLRIGNYGGLSGVMFDGYLSDVRIWDVVRTQSEIQDNKDKKILQNESNLVGYWPINEGEGTTAFDHSGNGRHGSILGGAGATWVKL